MMKVYQSFALLPFEVEIQSPRLPSLILERVDLGNHANAYHPFLYYFRHFFSRRKFHSKQKQPNIVQ